MPEPDRLQQLASRLARDRPVDWDDEEQRAATDEERDAIHQLRIVAAMAGFNRSVQASDAPSDLEASVSLARSLARAGPADATPAPHRDDADLPIGSHWGHLEIETRIGRGGFGSVYRARDTRLDRVVALKLLPPDTTSTPDNFVREARLLAKVRHPHVVTVHGADRIDGRVGIWMEFLRGETLERMLRTRGLFDAREAALVGIDLCRALAAVHSAGIVHRDVKLANIIRAEGGRIVLMDFGLGRESRFDAMQSRNVSGTPLFMAPEVLRGGQAAATSDVYSLGVVLFALVTGKLPIDASGFEALAAKHERGEVRRARDLRPDLPETFGQVLDRALAPDPEQRFASAGEVERALLQTLGATVQPGIVVSPSAKLQRWIPMVLGAALAVSLITLAVVAGSDRRAGIRSPTAHRPAPLAEAPTMTLTGEAENDLFGAAVAGVGDVDRDGFDDLLVAAPQHAAGGRNRGKAYLYRGGPSGLVVPPAWTAVGADDGQLFGWSIASATNLGDGFADILVGSPGNRDAERGGCVAVHAGSKDGPSSVPTQTIGPQRIGTLFGYAIATGDVDHDGDEDLLVGEPYDPPDTRSGRASLYLWQGTEFSTEPIWTAIGPAGSSFGIDVSLAGDIDHDGYADAVIGAPLASFGPDLPECGAAYVYLGSPAGLDSIPTVLPGCQAGARFGHDARIVGDLDGDGFADVFVGAEFGSNGEQQEGVGQVYFGSKTGVTPYGVALLESNVMGANFGICSGTLGDLDGDGCDDLFVGALRYQRTEPREGAAFVYWGARDRRFQQAWMRVRGKPGSWLGQRGGSAGDVDADGLPDFIVSAPSFDTETGANVGQVELFLNTRRR